MKTTLRFTLLSVTSVLILAGCGSDDDDEVMMPDPPVPEPVVMTYEVTITNLTAAQPLSPVAVMLTAEQQYWQVGMPASDALALLAEGGDNSELVNAGGVLAASDSGMPVGPGDSASVTVSVDDAEGVWLTVATMLVNTNDGFTGITGYDLNTLTIGDSVSMSVMVYDAGTEANTEAAGTIPGPADGGEGVSAGREEADSVFVHGGVVSQEDGLASSVLDQSHRFDNPAVKLSVTRVE
ncbi:spondin domain-containing protein [Alteromonas halophila]|uniref:Spondin domain-containing protein n=1 Tax=Alteromonas halophila TaxID=516698 RepID=A0A918JJV2_9ALTE|nr:spondin domain-containing protein [Alteromonas halophila]GGW80895.1 hypothetical protein GCM10007391_12410 [Alteromonas halophila]